MPHYEIVAQFAVELDGTVPEEAAGVFRRELLAGTGMNLRGLAVWPSAQGTALSALPPPLRQQLVNFFAAVARHAAVEEEVFRARVEEIFARAASEAAAVAASGGDGAATRENGMVNQDEAREDARWPS